METQVKNKIRVLLEEYGMTQTDLAEVIGCTYQSVSIKLNGKKDFNRTEIYRMMKCFNLTPEQVVDIFFTLED